MLILSTKPISMKKLMLYCLICFSLPFAVLSQTEELEIQSIRDSCNRENHSGGICQTGKRMAKPDQGIGRVSKATL